MSTKALSVLLSSLAFFLAPSAHAQALIDDRAVLKAWNEETWICNTPGGYVYDAILIGRRLQARQRSSLVPAGAVCASAGALAWLGGTRRESRGRLLFHAVSPEMSPDQKWRLFLILRSWDTPAFAAERIIALAPDQYWEPTGTDLVALLR